MLKDNLNALLFAISPDEIDDPFGIISDFCNHQSLFDARDEVFELYSLSMGSDEWRAHIPLEKTNRMYHLKLMIRMVEVIYLLNHLQKAGQLTKQIHQHK